MPYADAVVRVLELIDKGDSETPKYDRAIGAIASGDIAALEAIAASDSDFPLGRDDFIGDTWLSDAVGSGNADSVRWMIDRGAAVIYDTNDGYPALHTALELDPPVRYEILEMLCSAGANINEHGTNDWTPLHMAAARNDVVAIQILLAYGARKDIRTRIDSYATPLEEARSLGATDAVQALTELPNPDRVFHIGSLSISYFRRSAKRSK